MCHRVEMVSQSAALLEVLAQARLVPSLRLAIHYVLSVAAQRHPRALLPLLTQAPRGHLVNVSSIFGMVGIPTQSAYNAAKFAVRGFSEALQAEYLGTALSVSCVHPGGIRTNIARSARTDGSASVANADERDKQFQQMAHTTPERAAEIILNGTARGKRRILVGWDAWLVQQFIKLFPTSYHWVTARLAKEPQ